MPCGLRRYLELEPRDLEPRLAPANYGAVVLVLMRCYAAGLGTGPTLTRRLALLFLIPELRVDIAPGTGYIIAFLHSGYIIQRFGMYM